MTRKLVATMMMTMKIFRLLLTILLLHLVLLITTLTQHSYVKPVVKNLVTGFHWIQQKNLLMNYHPMPESRHWHWWSQNEGGIINQPMVHGFILIYQSNLLNGFLQSLQFKLVNGLGHYLIKALSKLTLIYCVKKNATCITAESLVLSKLRDYREQANRDRFILPEDKDVSFFTNEIDTCINFLT